MEVYQLRSEICESWHSEVVKIFVNGHFNRALGFIGPLLFLNGHHRTQNSRVSLFRMNVYVGQISVQLIEVQRLERTRFWKKSVT